MTLQDRAVDDRAPRRIVVLALMLLVAACSAPQDDPQASVRLDTDGVPTVVITAKRDARDARTGTHELSSASPAKFSR